MSITADQYEKLGTFYLGREYDLASKEANGDLVLYDSKDLVTHGVVLGMTGSGKTGLCLALLEEAAIDRIPAIVIDPKGDIANLLLTFPNLAPEDFRPWVNEEDAAKKGITPEQLAAKTAATWKQGLADWGQSPERIKTLRDNVDLAVFTPGSKAGIPVSILGSFDVPPFEVMDDAELLGERIESTVASLLSLVGVDADPIQSPEAILLANVFQKAWAKEENLTMESLIRHIQKPPFDKVGVLDVESFLGAKDRQSLALKFNNLLASPGFASWMDGAPLDIAKMLHAGGGKPRVAIFSISHLGDAERMFFVSLLLNQVLGWMRAQSGTTSLRAILYMDEIYGYLPPTANPPSKKPMMTMLKQARAFGLGCLLATQNPVDLDYKALSNIGTWWLGRLQTERDKLRVLDGLEGAAGAQNAKFDRATMEKLLSGLGNRVFLMNNVHEDQPVLFHVRWVMSYLCGPLTRTQIKGLMDPRRGDFGTSGAASPAPSAAQANPMAMPGMAEPETAPPGAGRPVVGQGVVEKFLLGPETARYPYRPFVHTCGTVRFSLAKARVDCVRKFAQLVPIEESKTDWSKRTDLPDDSEFSDHPQSDVLFSHISGVALNSTFYKQQKEICKTELERAKIEILFHKETKLYSKVDSSGVPEDEQAFRNRIKADLHRELSARKDELNQSYDAKRKRLEDEDQSLGRREDTAKGRFMSRLADIGIAIGTHIPGPVGDGLRKILGRRRSLGSVINKGVETVTQHKQSSDLQARRESLKQRIDELEERKNQELADLEVTLSHEKANLEKIEIRPTKSDINVESVMLLWCPHDTN